jgi:hypothetical protein
MNLELKLKHGEEIIECGTKFLKLIEDFYNITEEEAGQLEGLIKTDERFKTLNERMEELGNELGM